MRVVLDTNILISALFWTGAPNQILKLIETDTVELAISPGILRELHGVLNRQKFVPYLAKLQLSAEELTEHLVDLASLFSPDQELTIITEDLSDNQFLACALTAKADFIISGDRHLLALKSFHNIPILTPRQFLNQIQKQK